MQLSILKNYRNPELLGRVVESFPKTHEPLSFMEVCGTHTMAIGRWGIRRLLPPWIRLVSGPGCPVCVTPSPIIDAIHGLKGVTLATFGDLIRVPGRLGTLEGARARGLDVRIIYSPMEAVEMAMSRPTVLVGLGFETTTPGMAMAIKAASQRGIEGFSVLPAFKTVPAALEALLSDPEVNLNGFILPGHVSTVTGTAYYDFLVSNHAVGGVVTGFEPLDIVASVRRLVTDIDRGAPAIVNEYSRVVHANGNPAARKVVEEVFEPCAALWRGIGVIPGSGLKLRPAFARFDACVKYGLGLDETGSWAVGSKNGPGELGSAARSSTSCEAASISEDEGSCRCGDVLKGRILPPDCPLFGKACRPEKPFGPCMVSSEGSCAAYYKYERH